MMKASARMQKDRTPDAGVPSCRHHWKVDTPSPGDENVGATCMLCNQYRTFPAWEDDTYVFSLKTRKKTT